MNYYDPDPLRLSRERHQQLLHEADTERLAHNIRGRNLRHRRRLSSAITLSLKRPEPSFNA
jgi:hypothetical protein